MDNKYLTVGALTKYIKFKFDSDENLRVVFLKGEISNFKAHTTGHLYFSIKDETSKINAIMFSRDAKKLLFTPTDGTKVLLTGRISVYEATGNYQIYVEEMQEDGVGNLYIAFEKLKEKLNKEGLFKEEHKKIIPKIPKKVGVITAETGAAVRDIISTIKRRFPICDIYLLPCLVQGENASDDIVKKIKQANNFDFDVIILGRGGGSIEDLWPFNEEKVAYAIYESKIPIISAVGHETDFTIADFVSDLRAPTPTGAAELAVPNILDLQKYINQLNIRLNESITKKINYNKLILESVKNSFVIKNPMIMYENKKQNLININEKLNTIIYNKLEINKLKLETLKKHYILTNPEVLYKNYKIDLKNIIEKLELVNPLNILKRGYNITYKDNKLIKSSKNLKQNDLITIKMYDGNINAIVEDIEVK